MVTPLPDPPGPKSPAEVPTLSPVRPPDALAPAPAPDRRGFLRRLTAVLVGGLVGLFPFAAGLLVFTDPLRRRGVRGGFVRVTTLEAVADDGVPRRFTVLKTRVDAWSSTPDERVGAVYLRRVNADTVGLEVEEAADGALLIVTVIPNGPAERAGIAAGDRIKAIGGRPTANLSTQAAAKLLQGPKGSTVEITVVRGDGPARKLVLGREDPVPLALQSTCPHAGCMVEYRTVAHDFKCPCHNSAFGLDGQIIQPSPAPRPMDTLACEVRDKAGVKEVWVDFENFYTGVTEKKVKT